MLKKGGGAKPGEKLTPEEEIKDPLVLEFLGLKFKSLMSAYLPGWEGIARGRVAKICGYKGVRDRERALATL